jgi:hypothetical protein
VIHVCLEECPTGVAGVLTELATYQAAVDACASYAERVQAADAAWSSRRNNKPIQTVREMLLSMCTGLGRCMYCEDSRAHDIEHAWPKALYPGLVFAWANFLYACSGCNRSKGAKFKVWLPDGRIVDVARKSRTAVPTQLAVDDPLLIGAPLLIDPRSEDPLDFLRLDLETGVFDEIHRTGRRFDRANITIDLLGLNEREYLVEARRHGYQAADSLLADYVRLKRDGAGPAVTEPKRKTILGHAHRTVWEEMKRQRERLPKLRALFEAAPEALTW